MQVLTLHWVVSDTNPVRRGRNFSLLLSGVEVQPPQVVPTDTSEEGRGLRKRGSLLSHEESLGSPLSCLRLPQQGSCMPSSSGTRVESVLSPWPLLVGLRVGSTGFPVVFDESREITVCKCVSLLGDPFSDPLAKKEQVFHAPDSPLLFFFGPCPLAFWVTSFSSIQSRPCEANKQANQKTRECIIVSFLGHEVPSLFICPSSSFYLSVSFCLF